MTLRPLPILAGFLLTLVALSFARADQAPTTPAQPRAVPDALFDRAVESLSKNPVAAKPQFSRAAAAYERLLDAPLSQADRARVLYNAGAAHQLAGDFGRAVLDFRRAELLAPITPGLRERLAAARSAVAGEPLASSTPQDPSTWQDLRDFISSVPRVVSWRFAAAAFIAFWAFIFLRIIVPPISVWRPYPLLLWIAGLGVLLLIPVLAMLWNQDAQAAAEIVVLAETVGRDQPDDLTGRPSSVAPFKPGIELLALDHRIGGNGQTWVRVRPRSATASVDDPTLWIPAAAAASVLDH
jgi:hypothetical protein